jgi:hypothetical protein
MQTDPSPTAIMTPAQRAEFAGKKQALASARSLAATGRYDESIKVYDGYLQKYPSSVRAKQEQAEAKRSLEAAKAKSTVTSKASKPRTQTKSQPAVEEKKPPLWRRIFHRKKGT